MPKSKVPAATIGKSGSVAAKKKVKSSDESDLESEDSDEEDVSLHIAHVIIIEWFCV